MAGIYIHIPFCKQACYYCDFHFSTSQKRKEEILFAIHKELKLRRNEFSDSTIDSIYFGGGTPSLLTKEELSSLLDTIADNFQIGEHPEITLEANPDDLNPNKLKELSTLSINRLSIGVQSFFDEDLIYMNRAHTAKESVKCIVDAQKYFNNITIDLIYGIPGLSIKRWKENLKKTFELNIPHISSYALTDEKKTALYQFIKKGKREALSEELALAHFELLVKETEKRGYKHYEISNFGKPTFFSKHNSAYWLGEKYLGIGPSAHTFNKKERSWNIANNAIYIRKLMAGELPNEIEKLSEKDMFNELLMTGLRTVWGVSYRNVENDFGMEILKRLDTNSHVYVKNGLLKKERNKNGDTILSTTKKGKFLADGIASDLFLV